MDEITREFLIESTENLSRLDQQIVLLEKNPTNADLLASIFRAMHTIKGTGGMLGFAAVEGIAHLAENLLSQMRGGTRVLSPKLASLILKAVDAVKEELTAIEATGKETGASHDALRKELGLACEATDPVLPTAPAVNETSERPGTVVEVESSPHRSASEDSTIRVDVGLLDRLMTLVGELVLARNRILQFNATREDADLNASAQRLDLITTELQEGVMKTRMQPIGVVWNKLPRVVRDIAASSGKSIAIEMDGADTELDKTIIEAIKDPLTHLVRNCCDHGIETPAQRKAAGKPEQGTISLRAYHAGGQVNIEISDDGGGISTNRLKSKALHKGLLLAEQAERMTERELLNLIFVPGFSTAEKVTHISGRGVGMDVVKTNIEKIGGIVDLSTRLGQGTTLKVKIPLTLAIIPALIVTTAGDRYAIPQVNLLELIRLEGEHARKAIELVNGAPVYRLRGRLLPLVYLKRELKSQTDWCTSDPSTAPGADDAKIVVLRAHDRQFGLVVDEINDTEDIVVKPVSKHLKSLTCYAGACIMGDGGVALILDVMGLAQHANVIDEAPARNLAEKTADAPVGNGKRTFLLFAGPDDSRMAVPLDAVARLEEVPAGQAESAGSQWVTQYRGQILPLVDLESALAERRRRKRNKAIVEKPTLQVVVCNHEGRLVGLLVERILDIVEDTAGFRYPATRDGVLHSAVIQGRVTELLDIPAVLRAAGVECETPQLPVVAGAEVSQ